MSTDNIVSRRVEITTFDLAPKGLEKIVEEWFRANYPEELAGSDFFALNIYQDNHGVTNLVEVKFRQATT